MTNLARHVLPAILLLIALFNPAVAAQPQQKAMTNADVLEMVKAKVTAPLIVKTIENTQAVRFDVQPKTIVALKQAGVDDRIVEAMLKAMNRAPASAGGRGGSAAAPSSSYDDGYHMGWMYGDQFRRSGQRYNPDDIILPGILIKDMTVKLGALEYEKWQNGYFKGYEDGRLGRPRDPTGTAAAESRAAAAATREKANNLSPSTKSQISAARKSYRSAPVFGVFHDHGAGKGVCEGYVAVVKNHLVFKGNDSRGFGAHELDVAFDEIQEVKRNRLDTYGIPTFHVKLKDARNFNFLTPDNAVDDVVSAILSAMGTSRK